MGFDFSKNVDVFVCCGDISIFEGGLEFMMEELSKIKMKAGHFQMEMVGDPAYTEEPGISIQSNQGHIQFKTLEEFKSILDVCKRSLEVFKRI